MKTSSPRLGRSLFVLMAFVAIATLLLAACAPAPGLSGSAGQGNDCYNGQGANPKNLPACSSSSSEVSSSSSSEESSSSQESSSSSEQSSSSSESSKGNNGN